MTGTSVPIFGLRDRRLNPSRNSLLFYLRFPSSGTNEELHGPFPLRVRVTSLGESNLFVGPFRPLCPFYGVFGGGRSLGPNTVDKDPPRVEVPSSGPEPQSSKMVDGRPTGIRSVNWGFKRSIRYVVSTIKDLPSYEALCHLSHI